MFDAILKVGGSLYRRPRLRLSAEIWSALVPDFRLLVLPGGGPFANTVRGAAQRYALSDEAAHQMALLAMAQYGYFLADMSPRGVVVQSLAEAEAARDNEQVPILAPSYLLAAMDPLPHNWDVTSDSIAAWLAGHTGTGLLVLLKSIPGLYEPGDSQTLLEQAPLDMAIEMGLVDNHFGEALSAETTCWVLDGMEPGRLMKLLREGWTIGTRLVPGL